MIIINIDQMNIGIIMITILILFYTYYIFFQIFFVDFFSITKLARHRTTVLDYNLFLSFWPLNKKKKKIQRMNIYMRLSFFVDILTTSKQASQSSVKSIMMTIIIFMILDHHLISHTPITIISLFVSINLSIYLFQATIIRLTIRNDQNEWPKLIAMILMAILRLERE